jgi:hypothetical protein
MNRLARSAPPQAVIPPHRPLAAVRHGHGEMIGIMASPLAPRAADPTKLQEKIRTTAYLLYEKRGRMPGNDWADWFEAERIVQGRQAL